MISPTYKALHNHNHNYNGYFDVRYFIYILWYFGIITLIHHKIALCSVSLIAPFLTSIQLSVMYTNQSLLTIFPLLEPQMAVTFCILSFLLIKNI